MMNKSQDIFVYAILNDECVKTIKIKKNASRQEFYRTLSQRFNTKITDVYDINDVPIQFPISRFYHGKQICCENNNYIKTSQDVNDNI